MYPPSISDGIPVWKWGLDGDGPRSARRCRLPAAAQPAVEPDADRKLCDEPPGALSTGRRVFPGDVL